MFKIEIGDGEKAELLLNLVQALRAEAVVKQVMVLETDDENLAAIARRLGGAAVDGPASAPAGEVKRRGGRPKKNQQVEEPAHVESQPVVEQVPFEWPPLPAEYRVAAGPMEGKFLAVWEVLEAASCGDLEFGTFLDRRDGTKARVVRGRGGKAVIVTKDPSAQAASADTDQP